MQNGVVAAAGQGGEVELTPAKGEKESGELGAAGEGTEGRRCWALWHTWSWHSVGARLRKAWPDVRDLTIKHWLPISFVIALTVALAWPLPGRKVVHVTIASDVRVFQELAMIIVFFISGVTLSTQDLQKAKGHYWGVIFGFVSILLISPCLGWVMREIPLEPRLFSVGLVIYCAAPTTLGVGIALVRSAKGNEGVALLLTVGTCMLSVFSMPGLLHLLFLGYDLRGLSIKVDIPDLLGKLSITIMAPTIVGKVMRDYVPKVEPWVKRWRTQLSILSTTCLATIIWQTLSAARDNLLNTSGPMIVAVIAIAASLFGGLLVANWAAARFIFRLPMPELVAVTIIAAQKSAPVAVTLISYTARNPEEQGMLAVPCIVGQLTQIFVGSAIVPAIERRVLEWKQQQAELAAQAAQAEQQQQQEAEEAGQPGPDHAGDGSIALTVQQQEVEGQQLGQQVGPAGEGGQPGPAQAAGSSVALIVQQQEQR